MKFIFLLLVVFVLMFLPGLSGKFVAAPFDGLVGVYKPWIANTHGFVSGIPVKNALLSDSYNQFFIWKHMAADSWKKGIAPVVNSFSFLSTPLLATFHSTVLHPAITTLFLPVPWGWNLHIFLSHLTSAAAMFLLVKKLTKSGLASFLSGMAFSLGGPMTTWSHLGTSVWGMAAIPISLYSIITHKWFLLPIAVTWVFLSGNVQIVLYFCFTLFTFYLFHSHNRFTFAKLFLSLILGVCLAAIQLFPTLELFSRSIRSEEKYSSMFNYGLNSFSQAIRLLAPDFFGHPTTYNFSSTYAYHDFSPYFGTLALVLTIFGLILSLKNKQIRFYSFGFVASLALSFDWFLPRLIFSLELPLLTYSLASRVYFLTVFFGSVLLGFGVASLIKSPKAQSNLVIVSVLALIWLLISLFQVKFDTVSLRNSLLPVFALSYVVFLVFTFKNFPRISSLVLCIVFIAELSRFYFKYNPFAPSSLVYPTTQTTTYLATHSEYAFVSLSENVLPPNTWNWYQIRSPEGYDPLHGRDFNSYSHTLSNGLFTNTPSRFVNITIPNLNQLRFSNVGYYVIDTQESQKIHNLNLQLVWSGEGIDIYFDPQALPQKYFTHNFSYISSRNISDFLASNLPNQFAVSNSPIPNHKLLVFAKSYDPNWQSTYFGSKLTRTQVNGGLLGFFVPDSAKIEDIHTYYAPNSLLTGALISLLALLVTLLVLKNYKNPHLQV